MTRRVGPMAGCPCPHHPWPDPRPNPTRPACAASCSSLLPSIQPEPRRTLELATIRVPTPADHDVDGEALEVERADDPAAQGPDHRVRQDRSGRERLARGGVVLALV